MGDFFRCMKQELAVIEKEIEVLIERGTKVWQRIADLLMKVRDKELWKEDHKSFKSYVEERWGRTPTWAYQLMKSRMTVKELAEKVTQVTASNVDNPRSNKLVVEEKAARTLSRMSEERREEVSGHIDFSKPITEAAVEQAVQAAKPAKVVVEDEMGTIIPESAVPLWERRGEIAALIRRLYDTKHDIVDRQKNDDVLYKSITQNCLDKMSLVTNELRSSYPEVVCGSCEGRVPKSGCGTCRSTGFQSRKDYDRLTPVEDQNIRKAAIESRKHAAPRLSTTVSRLNH